MDGLLESLKPLLAALGVDPMFYGALAALGIINAALTARIAWWDAPESVLLAFGISLALGVASAFEHHLLPVTAVIRCLTLAAAALLTEAAAAAWLPKVPGIGPLFTRPEPPAPLGGTP